MTAAQALTGHPWIRNAQQVKVPLDMIIYKLMRAYISSSSLRKSALRALAKKIEQVFVKQSAYWRNPVQYWFPASGYVVFAREQVLWPNSISDRPYAGACSADGLKPIQVPAWSYNREVVELLLPLTSPIHGVSNWTVYGIIEHLDTESEEKVHTYANC